MSAYDRLDLLADRRRADRRGLGATGEQGRCGRPRPAGIGDVRTVSSSVITEREEHRTMQARPHLPAAVVSAEDAPAFWRVGILWNISLSAATTAGEFTMLDQTMPRGAGAPPHVHERYDEGFFIIEGAVEYTVGEGGDAQTILAEDGAAVWIPRGTRHAFEVRSETARALNFYTPGGFDESISMLATPAAARTLPTTESGENDPRGFRTDPAKEAAYRDRISELHSQSMP